MQTQFCPYKTWFSMVSLHGIVTCNVIIWDEKKISKLSLLLFLSDATYTVSVPGILMIMCTVIYCPKTTHDFQSEIEFLRFSFGFSVASGCLSIISGALYFCAEKRQLGNHRQRSDPNHVGYSSGTASDTPRVVFSVPVHNNL